MKRNPTERRAGWLRVGAMVHALAATLCVARAAADTISVPADAQRVLVPLPAGQSGSSDTLVVELDGYDVTAVVVRSEGQLHLPTRGLDLSAGQHSLRILAVRESGDIDTLLEHVLDVQAQSRSSHRRWNVLLGSGHRIAEESSADFAGARRDQYRAALEGEMEGRSTRWALRGSGGALYDNVRESSPDGALWQSPAYQLQAERVFESGEASVTLGDDAIALGNLLFSGFSRRGLRADASALEDRLQAQIFTLYSDPRTRLDEDLLPSHREERAIGGYTTISPLSLHPEWLRISAGFLDGEGTLGGAAVSSLDPEVIVGGHAWNAAIDSWTWGASLWMHLEYAKSRFDSDGVGQGVVAQSDDARQFVMQLGSGGSLVLPGLDEWALGWQRQIVGPGFFSLGNLMLPGDLSLDHGYLRLGWQGLQIGADRVSQHSDVEDDPVRPRQESVRRSVTASYTPLYIDPQSGPWRLLGTPTLSAELERVEFEQPDSDTLIAGYDLDSRLRTTAFGLDLVRSSVAFGVRYSEIRFDDRSQALLVDDFPIYEPAGDTVEQTTTVQLSWNPGTRFMLAPQFQRSRLRGPGTAGTSHNDLWGLQCQAELVREALWLQASYSETRDRRLSADLLVPEERFTSGGGAANLIYRMRVADGAWPTIDWQLGGQYASTDSQDSWQLHLGFELSWSRETE